MNRIEVEDVRFNYYGMDRPVLDGINLTIERNETVLLLGASGAGKSSLGLCLNGLIPNIIHGNFSGSVRIFGRNTTKTTVAELTKHVGIVFQDPEAQLVCMKVEDEIAFGMENLCLDRVEMERRMEKALEETGLSDYRQCPVDLLSGGQKQRLALASVLCMQPQVLILDEPTAYLDPIGTKELFEVLRRLQQSGDYTIILIEHKLDDLMDMISRVIVLGKKGKIIADGKPHTVFYKHYDLLHREGVWLPQCVKLVRDLQKKRLYLSEAPLTINETVNMLEKSLSPIQVRKETQPKMKSKQSGYSDSPFAIEIKPAEISPDRSCILQPMRLCVPRGDFLAITGANGAGKSTLVRHMMKLHKINKHVIYIHGRDVTQLPAHTIVQEAGSVFQNPEHQFVTNRVADELAFGLKCMNISETEINKRVEEMLYRFGLVDYAEMSPFQLSHGEKRRLSVASMLITGQILLIFDEPTFGQDLQNAIQLMEIMKQLQQEGNTILMISHDMG